MVDYFNHVNDESLGNESSKDQRILDFCQEHNL